MGGKAVIVLPPFYIQNKEREVYDRNYTSRQ